MGNFLAVAGIFAVLQLINVVLNTAKTLIMARTDNPHMSALINAVTFGFYTVVVKQIATLDITMTTVVVVLTNVIGVYLTYWLARKLRKDTLWKTEIYISDPEVMASVKTALQVFEIGYAENSPEVLTAYCYTQQQSKDTADAIRGAQTRCTVLYNITEITKHF